MSKKKRNNHHRRAPAVQGSAHTASADVAVIDEPVDQTDDVMPRDAGVGAPVSALEAPALDAQADAAPSPVAIDPRPAPPRPAGPSSQGWTPHESGDIRGVLIQIGGGRLLLPNATIAEVLSYAEPEPVESQADWLLGRFRWRGWQLPLVAFSRLAGIGEEQPGLGSKVIVLKALGGDRRIPYFAILTQGFPRLVTVARSALEVEADDGALPEAIQARVRLNDEPALLPDLLRIEHMLQADREAA